MQLCKREEYKAGSVGESRGSIFIHFPWWHHTTQVQGMYNSRSFFRLELAKDMHFPGIIHKEVVEGRRML